MQIEHYLYVGLLHLDEDDDVNKHLRGTRLLKILREIMMLALVISIYQYVITEIIHTEISLIFLHFLLNHNKYNTETKHITAYKNILKEQKIRGNHNPGAGGWPTVRYFNKDTGVEGAPYTKKTSKAMCDELGDIEYMTAYVEEAGGTSKCALDGTGCSERQVKYIEKMKAKGKEAQEKQFKRLDGMQDKDMTDELKDWKNKRKKILQQLIKEEL